MNSKRKHVYYDKTEEISIIRLHQDLIMYVYNLLIKYPPLEGGYLAGDIRRILNEVLEELIKAKRTFGKKDKLKHLNQADIKLESLLVFVRISYKVKYINKKNYGSWSHKISNIMDELDKWVLFCQS